ncbi:MAG: CotS family spore coat protein [Halanaerobiales bacterium]|nr:CotS family spore coat protein [Halanaerobiales bacterium]
MNEQLIHLIEKEYEIRVNDFKPLKKAWVLQTNQGSFFSKPFCFKDGSRLRFIDGAMQHLIKQGFDYIIPMERTRKDIPYISYAEDIFFMTPFMNLRQSNYDNPSELAQAARILAGLHLGSHGYEPGSELNPQSFWGLWPRRFKEKIQHLYTFRLQLQHKNNWDIFDQIFTEKYPYYFNQANVALRRLLLTDYNRLMYNEQRFHTICHHDFEYHNLLISPQEQYYVIDFDYLLCDTHLHDLASILIRAGKRSNWKNERGETILSNYHQIYPLRPEEIPVIKAIMFFPQDFWQVAFARYFEKQPWPVDRFARKITQIINHEKERLHYIENLHFPE